MPSTTQTAVANVVSSTTTKICSACNKPGENLLACARCKQAWYHNKQCQLDHFPKHKATCRQLVAAARQQQQKIPLAIATVDSEGQQTLADGIKVIETSELGKACIATKAFSTGDTVLLEPPAVVFDERDGYTGLFSAFLKASKETQQKILLMYRPPPEETAKLMARDGDDKRQKIRQKRKQLLVEQYHQFVKTDPTKKQVLPLSTAEQLIGVVDANAHAFQAQHTVDIVATSTNNAVPRTYHALFTLGSKVEHSCSPNLTFITKGGKLEYIAEMDIQPQQRLSISYMGSVYEQPRKQRRGFLKENKMFICKCVRCRGFDECSPLRCDKCCVGGGGDAAAAVMFHHGERDQWECQSCDNQLTTKECLLDKYMQQQMLGEANLHTKIRRQQYILQTQPYPELLEEILRLVKSPDWRRFIHPLHWLNVEAYKLLSSIAASAARYHVKDHHASTTSDRVASLLRVSAMAMLRRILWLERTVAIDRGLLSLKEAADQSAQETFDQFTSTTNHKQPRVSVKDVTALVDQLCSSSVRGNTNDWGTLGVSPAFHAGQDLILAGHKELAYKLYKRFEISFQRWKGLSHQSRNKIKVFLDSGGKECPFGNFLLL